MSYAARVVAKLRRTHIAILRSITSIGLRVNPVINWCLVYGVERSGTSLMLRMLAATSLRVVSDWGLSDLLKLTPEYSYITFDRERALRDISSNILDNAASGGGTKLDLVYKQASIDVHEYEMLVKMWGHPAKKIFCFREPSGYIASATKKFPNSSLSQLQSLYIEAFRTYEEIGADIFEYSESLSTQHYIEFLSPLVSGDSIKEDFYFVGKYEPEKVTEEMWVAYQGFRQKYLSKIFPYIHIGPV